MKRNTILGLVVIGIVILAFNIRVGYAEPSTAPKTTGYTIDWYTIEGGGAQDLVGGPYTLSGTIGQYDAGTMSGGSYKVNGGFWGFLDSMSKLYLPFILR